MASGSSSTPVPTSPAPDELTVAAARLELGIVALVFATVAVFAVWLAVALACRYYVKLRGRLVKQAGAGGGGAGSETAAAAQGDSRPLSEQCLSADAQTVYYDSSASPYRETTTSGTATASTSLLPTPADTGHTALHM